MMQTKVRLQNELANLQDKFEREKLAKDDEMSTFRFLRFGVSLLTRRSEDAKRKLQSELQDVKVSSGASSAKHAELAEALKAYRAKAENYLTRLEQNEIERAKAANGEAFGMSTQECRNAVGSV